MILLHNIAMQCYWAKEEPHPAILHAMKAHELTLVANDLRKQSAILGNIGAILEVLGEWDLSLTASLQAWSLAVENTVDQTELPLPILSNLVLVCVHKEKFDDALRYAELLLSYISSERVPVLLGFFENLFLTLLAMMAFTLSTSCPKSRAMA